MEEAALKRALNEDEANELEDLAPSSFFLIREPAKTAKEMDINGMISYLKSEYSADKPNQRDALSFEEISKELKATSKHIKEGKNMSLKIRLYLLNGDH